MKKTGQRQFCLDHVTIPCDPKWQSECFADFSQVYTALWKHSISKNLSGVVWAWRKHSIVLIGLRHQYERRETCNRSIQLMSSSGRPCVFLRNTSLGPPTQDKRRKLCKRLKALWFREVGRKQVRSRLFIYVAVNCGKLTIFSDSILGTQQVQCTRMTLLVVRIRI